MRGTLNCSEGASVSAHSFYVSSSKNQFRIDVNIDVNAPFEQIRDRRDHKEIRRGGKDAKRFTGGTDTAKQAAESN